MIRGMHCPKCHLHILHEYSAKQEMTCGNCGHTFKLKTLKPKDLTVKMLEKKSGLKADEWPGNCTFIAHAAWELIVAREVYGLWDGPIARGSVFEGRAFTHHGWLELVKASPRDKTTVVDPTRWCFEMVPPYIYIGSEPDLICYDFEEDDDGFSCVLCSCTQDEHAHSGFFRPCYNCQWPYDEGGNRWREENQSAPPKFDSNDPTAVALNITGAARGYIQELFGEKQDKISGDQIFWLANLSYNTLQPHTSDIYSWLTRLGRGAFIPLDNHRKWKFESADIKKEKLD